MYSTFSTVRLAFEFESKYIQKTCLLLKAYSMELESEHQGRFKTHFRETHRKNIQTHIYTLLSAC